jgi:hypothetical protein
MPYTVNLPNGEVLTGQLWRMQSPLFSSLPFTTNIFRIEGHMNRNLIAFLETGKKADNMVQCVLYVQTTHFPGFVL